MAFCSVVLDVLIRQRVCEMNHLFVLNCEECTDSAIKEVWMSENIADFIHFCEKHWNEFEESKKRYVAVYDLR